MLDKKKKTQGIVAFLLFASILIIDQLIKIEVKTSMSLYESHEVTSWFYITFVENNGMAYGMTFIPKYALSIFRLIAICVIGWYLCRQIMNGARWVYIILLSMVLAGATGNLVDCMFYGMCFTQSTPDYVSYVVPFGEGYSNFLTGKVVDMFYFPLIVSTYPDWVPHFGGQPFIFFQPVFNFADASISCSVAALLLFCRKELSEIGTMSRGEDNSNTDK
ncbi:lipoprotein signal peptidase [Prevotella sp. PINT]|jgi:Lipoprotein signal peptidase|uniref:lipoprotein signal peptidase n=1 Tax=Palleniella intestinalis TaxID=2736291 RepID=UPI0015534038|nr:lipoprotein signal peptidase [Palleniella intestinalis]NPD80671.1 lipoprotein signal peptidase [Palleniella intestinalis]